LIIVIGAPRTIGRSGFLEADDGGRHTKDEQKNPHGNLQSRGALSRQNSKISGSQTQIAIQVFYSRISRRGAAFAANIGEAAGGLVESFEREATEPAPA
jgi:hypothetical protein